jgi:hypothetical protein
MEVLKMNLNAMSVNDNTWKQIPSNQSSEKSWSIKYVFSKHAFQPSISNWEKQKRATFEAY